MHMLFDVTDNSYGCPPPVQPLRFPGRNFQNGALQQQVIGAVFLYALLTGDAQGEQNKMLTKKR